VALRRQQILGMTELPVPRVHLPPKARRKASTERLSRGSEHLAAPFFPGLSVINAHTFSIQMMFLL
jgi:hypothetical protein